MENGDWPSWFYELFLTDNNFQFWCWDNIISEWKIHWPIQHCKAIILQLKKIHLNSQHTIKLLKLWKIRHNINNKTKIKGLKLWKESQS